MDLLKRNALDAPELHKIVLDVPLFIDGKLVGVERLNRWLSWPAGPRGLARILVVDDDKDTAMVFSKALGEQGYQVARAFDGVAGLAAIRALMPDLALINLVMPGMTGDRLTQELRRDVSTTGMKIILTSASSKIERVAAMAGAQDFLSLPSTMSMLLSKVEKALRV